MRTLAAKPVGSNSTGSGHPFSGATSAALHRCHRTPDAVRFRHCERMLTALFENGAFPADPLGLLLATT